MKHKIYNSEYICTSLLLNFITRLLEGHGASSPYFRKICHTSNTNLLSTNRSLIILPPQPVQVCNLLVIMEKRS